MCEGGTGMRTLADIAGMEPINQQRHPFRPFFQAADLDVLHGVRLNCDVILSFC